MKSKTQKDDEVSFQNQPLGLPKRLSSILIIRVLFFSPCCLLTRPAKTPKIPLVRILFSKPHC